MYLDGYVGILTCINVYMRMCMYIYMLIQEPQLKRALARDVHICDICVSIWHVYLCDTCLISNSIHMRRTYVYACIFQIKYMYMINVYIHIFVIYVSVCYILGICMLYIFRDICICMLYTFWWYVFLCIKFEIKHVLYRDICT